MLIDFFILKIFIIIDILTQNNCGHHESSFLFGYLKGKYRDMRKFDPSTNCTMVITDWECSSQAKCNYMLILSSLCQVPFPTTLCLKCLVPYIRHFTWWQRDWYPETMKFNSNITRVWIMYQSFELNLVKYCSCKTDQYICIAGYNNRYKITEDERNIVLPVFEPW